MLEQGSGDPLKHLRAALDREWAPLFGTTAAAFRARSLRPVEAFSIPGVEYRGSSISHCPKMTMLYLNGRFVRSKNSFAPLRFVSD